MGSVGGAEGCLLKCLLGLRLVCSQWVKTGGPKLDLTRCGYRKVWRQLHGRGYVMGTSLGIDCS